MRFQFAPNLKNSVFFSCNSTDTEVLLEVCEHWGFEAAVKRMNGIFAVGYY